MWFNLKKMDIGESYRVFCKRLFINFMIMKGARIHMYQGLRKTIEYSKFRSLYNL